MLLGVNILRTLVVAVDMCASTNIIRRDALPEKVEICAVEDTYMPKIQDANRKLMKFAGIAASKVQVGGVDTKTFFFVSETLPVQDLVGTGLIADHVGAIISPEITIIVGGKIFAMIDDATCQADQKADLRAAH
jgi:hypothetical protein